MSPAGHLGQRSVWTSARSPPGVPRAGTHCQRVHTHLVQAGQIDLQHVQADELYAPGLHPTLHGGSGGHGPERARRARPALGGVGVWRQAMAMAVPGAPLARRREISAPRDKQVTWRASYADPRLRAQQHKALGLRGRREQLCGGDHPCQSSDRVRTGAGAVPARVCSPGVILAQVVKTSLKRRVVQVSRRIVRGSPEVVAQQAAPFVRRS